MKKVFTGNLWPFYFLGKCKIILQTKIWSMGHLLQTESESCFAINRKKDQSYRQIKNQKLQAKLFRYGFIIYSVNNCSLPCNYSSDDVFSLMKLKLEPLNLLTVNETAHMTYSIATKPILEFDKLSIFKIFTAMHRQRPEHYIIEVRVS